jgi:integrase
MAPSGGGPWRQLRYEDVAPLAREARAAVERYLQHYRAVGLAPLFPSRPDDATSPAWRPDKARHYLRMAERLAGLPHLERGGFHSYRRLFASERKHYPDVDVARAGGWRDLATMKRSYQQPDPVTVLQAIENVEPGKAGGAEGAELAKSGQEVGKGGS